MKPLKDFLSRAIRMSGVTADMAAGVTLVAMGTVVGFGFAVVMKLVGYGTSAGDPFDEEVPTSTSWKHVNETGRCPSLSLVEKS